MVKWILVGALLVLAILGFLYGGIGTPPPVPVLPPASSTPMRLEPGTFAPPDAPVPASPEFPPPPVAPAPAGSTLVVKGRIVDDRRFPVAGAGVVLHADEGRVLAVPAGDDGAFRFEGIPRPDAAWTTFALVARVPGGRLAVGQVYVQAKGPTELDAGVLVAGAAVPLAVRVLDGGAAVPGARVKVGWEFSWPFEAAAGTDGVARFDALPRQTVSILATAEDPARAGRGDAALQGEAPRSVDVALAPARTIEVLVVEKGTEKPIPGATFRVRLQRRFPGMVTVTDPGPLPPVPPTDADGRTRIAGTCAADWLTLDEATAPGYFPADFRRGTNVKPGEAQVRIELAGSRALRFPVVAGEAPVPPDGSPIALSAMPGSGGPDPRGGARMEGSDLVVETASAAHFAATAAAPDGSRAWLWADDKGTPPKEVSFRPARTIEILARRPDGTPAPGAIFALRNQGNNPMGDPRVADADGRVVFDGLYGQLVEVYLLEDATAAWGGRPVGSVDLAKGGGRLEAVVHGKRTFVARVTVDGTPRLVAPMYVSMGNSSVTKFAEDPEKGEIRFEATVDPAAASIAFTLNALPWLPATATVGPVPADGPIPLTFALRSGGVLLAEVRMPKEVLGLRLSLETWDEGRSAWIWARVPGVMTMGLVPGPDGMVRAEPLVEGRYRITETTTGVSSEVVEVRPGSDPARLVLDISRQGWARGKVSIPEGAAMGEVRILVKGTGLPEKPATGGFDNPAPRCQPDGSFMVRVPGDRVVSLVPWHPTLVPAPEGGIAEVTEPRDDLALRMVAGSRATFRLSPSPAVPQWAERKPRVLLFAGDPSGEPVSEHAAMQDGDALAFGGFQPGTWTLWIDPAEKFAPAVVRGVVLAGSGTDLGTVALVEGSRVRVKILVKEGTAVPRIAVFAVREEAPKYSRFMNSQGEETAVVSGLGPGRFRINATATMGTPGKMIINEVREIDGTNDLELTLDLR